MVELLGTSWGVFVTMTVVLIGGASFMTGQALARSWRPMWQMLPYGLLLGGADRFLTWGLFDGELWLLSGYLIDTAVIIAIGAVAYRATLAHRMVRQYPWLYERSGLLGWRPKA